MTADSTSLPESEISRARATCAGRDLEQTSPFMDGAVTLRWTYTHLIGV